jgi:hypothetical protein
VSDAELHAAEGIWLDEINEFPADGALWEASLEFTDEGGGSDALQEAANGAGKADIDLREAKFEVIVGAQFGEVDVVDADDLAALGINDLLIEEILLDGEPGFVEVVGVQGALVDVEIDAAGDDFGDLIVTGDQGLEAAAGDEEVGDAVGLIGGLDEKFSDAADEVGVGVVSGGADEFRGVEHKST